MPRDSEKKYFQMSSNHYENYPCSRLSTSASVQQGNSLRWAMKYASTSHFEYCSLRQFIVGSRRSTTWLDGLISGIEKERTANYLCRTSMSDRKEYRFGRFNKRVLTWSSLCQARRRCPPRMTFVQKHEPTRCQSFSRRAT